MPMLRAKDVMTTPVVSVQSDSTVRHVAEFLVEHGISAVPVIDGDRLVGIVSEGDLLHRTEIGTMPRHRSWWLTFFRDGASLAAEYTKSHSTRVADVMTRDVITVAEITPLAEVADILDNGTHPADLKTLSRSRTTFSDVSFNGREFRVGFRGRF